MAKKKAAKKPPKVKAKKKALVPKRAKAQKLPGMDQPKVRSLDSICEKLSDVRETLNDARKKEKELIGNALAALKNHSLQGYRAHGIELYRVAGDEKVRVRIVDSDEGGEEPEDGADEYMGGMGGQTREEAVQRAQEEENSKPRAVAAGE
jgi:hypothetical protein